MHNAKQRSGGKHMNLTRILGIILAINAGYVSYRLITQQEARRTWLWICCYWTLLTLRWIADLTGR